MKKIFIVLLIIGLLIPAISAEEVLIDSGSSSETFTVPKLSDGNRGIDSIGVYRIQDYKGLKFVYVNCPYAFSTSIIKASPYYSEPVTLKVGSTTVGHGIASYNGMFNSQGDVIGCQFYVDITDFDPGTLTGTQKIELIPDSGTLFNGITVPSSYSTGTTTNRISETFPIGLSSTYSAPAAYQFPVPGNHIIRTEYYWENRLNIDNSNLHLIRNLDGKTYFSTLSIMSDSGTFNDASGYDITVPFVGQLNWTVTSPYGKIFNGTSVTEIPGGPDAIPINIRVQNSQTGALLADAHVNITASVNGTFHEVVNETLPAGTKTYYLQPTGGGLPNPDFYRLIATVEGYNAIMPYIDFEADIATTIYAYLNPVGGAPVDENKTFIDFYVRDLNANPVAGATVKFGAYTLLTNSAGYTIFEVEKDKNYVWTVSKSGYGSVTGNAVIGSNDRYTINAVIAPAVTPTLTTPIPTSTTAGPTPTMTAPTGEPVSNLLEWFAAHFGMLLGGGVEIGKIFMWLCFTIPAGVYVGKEAKAGAAGFLAGAGIVTLFFVIIGWVPVWLVVLLALIVGLLYAKVFSNVGNGGGR